MRIACFMMIASLAACSVEKKQPLADAGTDSPTDGPDDDLAPETTITAAPAEFSRQGASTFTFTSDDPAATFECSIDGDTRVPCTSPYTRVLGDGTHAFSVRAIDTAGNGDDTPAEHAWTIDSVAPETMLTLAPPGADNSAMVRFEFDTNEDNAAFECSLDGGGYLPCASGDEFGPLGDGAHSFAVRARDRAGNLDASPAVYAWLVDTSTPDTTLLSGPSGATSATSATFTFVSPDAGAGATFQCSLDGGPYVACTSPRDLAALDDGSHTFRVRVRDAVGNVDPTPAARTWIVDLTPPETQITAGPSGLETVATATITFGSNEDDTTFQCSLDQSAFAACSSPFVAPGLAQGAHTFAVRAIDQAGHIDATPATRAWTVDTVAPDVAITAGPANGSTSGPRVAFTFTVSDGTVACSLDTEPFAPCASPVAWNLPAGAHQLRVRATDAAGNTATETRAWTVACAPPDASGAAGLLHLDAADQELPNAVAGGASATLGDDTTVEPADPAGAAGRFGGGLAFSPAEGDRVQWPTGLAPLGALTVELWARPDAPASSRDLVVTGDGRFAIRATAVSPAMIRFTATAVADGGDVFTATSANVAAGAWHHVLVSLDEPALRLWVDGARTEVGGVTLGVPPSPAAVRLGGNYQGALDEVWLAQTPIATDAVALERYCPAM